MMESFPAARQVACETMPPVARFDDVAISFHWLTLALVIGQFTTAWLLGAVNDAHQAQLVLWLHRSLGITTWAVTAGRLAWRLLITILPPFPPGMPKLQQQIAKMNEYGLYLLLFLQPLTGLAQTLFRGRPFPLFFLQVPAMIEPNAGLVQMFRQLHEAGAIGLLGLIGIHALAALFHRFVLKDEVMQRMLPARPRSVTSVASSSSCRSA